MTNAEKAIRNRAMSNAEKAIRYKDMARAATALAATCPEKAMMARSDAALFTRMSEKFANLSAGSSADAGE
jgi:hypothetical protein